MALTVKATALSEEAARHVHPFVFIMTSEAESVKLEDISGTSSDQVLYSGAGCGGNCFFPMSWSTKSAAFSTHDPRTLIQTLYYVWMTLLLKGNDSSQLLILVHQPLNFSLILLETMRRLGGMSCFLLHCNTTRWWNNLITGRWTWARCRKALIRFQLTGNLTCTIIIHFLMLLYYISRLFNMIVHWDRFRLVWPCSGGSRTTC